MVGGNTPQAERMRKQGYTEEEIEDMLKYDREIDRGADLFPLSAELENGAKKARRADRTDTPKKVERKPNEDKVRIMSIMKNALENVWHSENGGMVNTYRNFEVVNAEREFLFTYNGTKYRVVMSIPRGQ